MTISQKLAQNLHQVYHGGNWTCVNYKDTLKDISWEQALMQKNGLNSIATMFVHASYYVNVLQQVLNGEGLKGKDELSFILPEITSQSQWQAVIDQAFDAVASTVELLNQMNDARLHQVFVEEKYGTYYRNISGTIEHLHYHLGQISWMRKMLQPETN